MVETFHRPNIAVAPDPLTRIFVGHPPDPGSRDRPGFALALPASRWLSRLRAGSPGFALALPASRRLSRLRAG
ncbi:hypothetical protein GCM10010112_79290 [Actinoplanes lobatus]|nr:hypothetical protein GCM10010112_79290 [Actinoplanes lobatus]